MARAVVSFNDLLVPTKLNVQAMRRQAFRLLTAKGKSQKALSLIQK